LTTNGSTETEIRKKFRVMQTLWKQAGIYQNHSDGTKHHEGDKYHADALTLENELVALCCAATAAGKQEWNRIEDSTPEMGRTILMWSYYSHNMHMGYYDRGLWIGPNGSLGGITHWMLPPEVPK